MLRRLPEPLKAPLRPIRTLARLFIKAARGSPGRVHAYRYRAKVFYARQREAWVEEPKRIAGRKAIAAQYLAQTEKLVDEWAASHREASNFVYDLTDLNKRHLEHCVAVATGKPIAEIRSYLAEIEADEDLRQHLAVGMGKAAQGIRVEFGRRVGWYAIARAIKPKVVVETGIDLGMGGCVLASALLRNRAEGFEGRYYGTDIRPEAGELFAGRYAEAGQILYGDSIESLRRLGETIDLFINDSDHSAAYEYDEFQTVKDKLSERAFILGDNSHVTDALTRFAEETGRQFVFFAEKPRDHWYPGAGIGIAWRP